MKIMLLNNQLKTYNIEIPKDLKNKVKCQLDALNSDVPTWKKMIKTLSLSAAMVLITLTLMIAFVKPIAVMASEIPGLKQLVELFHNDLGIEHAKDQNYPAETYVLHQDGYTIILADVMIDEDRIDFKGSVNHQDWEDPNQYDVTWQLIGGRANGLISTGIQFGDNASAHISGTFYDAYEQSNNPDSEVTTLQDLLDSNQSLSCEIAIYDKTKYQELENEKNMVDNPPIHTMLIDIPIEADNILLSTHVPLNQTISLDEGDIIIEELIISPTRMKMITSSIPKPGFDSVMLDEFFIEENSSHMTIAPGSGLVTHGDGHGYTVYYMTPSPYFETDTLDFSLILNSYKYSISIAPIEMVPGQASTTVQYGQQTLTINEVNKEGQSVTIDISADLLNNFEIQGLEALDLYLGGESSFYSGMDDVGWRVVQTFSQIEEKEAYSFKLFGAYFIVDFNDIIDLED